MDEQNRPYTDPNLVSITTDPTQPAFIIHASILRQSTSLAAQYDQALDLAPPSHPKPALNLDFVGTAPVHVLVHYLYTQRYDDPEPCTSSAQACALATRVYFAAAHFSLDGLVGLAQARIERSGKELGVEEMLGAVRECAFPVGFKKRAGNWFSGFLEGVIEEEVRRCPETFRKPGFLACVEGNKRLLEVVWRTVMGAAIGSKSAESESGPDGGEGVLGERDGEDVDADGESSPLTPVFAARGFTAADDSIEPADSLTASSERSSDAVELHQRDELVDGGSPASSVQAFRNDEKAASHARSDSVVQIDDVVVDGGEKEAAVEPEAEPEVVSKKKKTKKKTKKLALLPMGV